MMRGKLIWIREHSEQPSPPITSSDRIARLESFVRESVCECYDEYGQPKAQRCDRCALLAEQPSQPITANGSTSITPDERAALDRLVADQHDHLGERVCDLAICATIAMREHADEPSQPITANGSTSITPDERAALDRYRRVLAGEQKALVYPDAEHLARRRDEFRGIEEIADALCGADRCILAAAFVREHTTEL